MPFFRFTAAILYTTIVFHLQHTLVSTFWDNTRLVHFQHCVTDSNTVNVHNHSNTYTRTHTHTPISQHLSFKQQSHWTRSALWVQSTPGYDRMMSLKKSKLRGTVRHFGWYSCFLIQTEMIACLWVHFILDLGPISTRSDDQNVKALDFGYVIQVLYLDGQSYHWCHPWSKMQICKSLDGEGLTRPTVHFLWLASTSCLCWLDWLGLVKRSVVRMSGSANQR